MGVAAKKTISPEEEPVNFGVLDHMLGYKLRRAQLTFFNSFSAACSDLGISPGLFGVLVVVKENPGLTQTAVAKALANDRSAMVGAVDKLEQMKLIERRPSKKDRRSYALFMTRYGLEFIEKLTQRVREQEEQLYKLLKPGEKETLLSILDRFD
ncbi:MarR family winged helix-turn-helix transcriptional regulator [Marinobacter oulmenensis]|uniref:DNA-binding MarR family transcriptional regulator n=1 Tax=Marinobacter oulmenensis TaxID=643747 RepID=A0A840UEE5_9GAMM|nr:MarR family transcriptional regulator [Marinobacter oulmenensis]MBB5321750.1 DNA-binding MarR family transcriptional regulator [Marinobacter oulmenensis]